MAERSRASDHLNCHIQTNIINATQHVLTDLHGIVGGAAFTAALSPALKELLPMTGISPAMVLQILQIVSHADQEPWLQRKKRSANRYVNAVGMLAATMMTAGAFPSGPSDAEAFLASAMEAGAIGGGGDDDGGGAGSAGSGGGTSGSS